MKFLSRIVGIVLFILFFGFALKNTQEVALRFFLGYEIHAPLVLMLLAFFAGGAILGVLAMTPTVVRYRRNSDHQKNAALAARTAGGARETERAQPPQPDAY
jgi:lipopolysaccharide assembly protein A